MKILDDDSIVSEIEEKLGLIFPIFDRQIKWNEFGVHYKNGILIGIGFYSQKIIEIPTEIWKLENIEVLNIVNCGLKTISEDIGRFKLLKELYIGGNYVKNLPRSIKNLEDLETLYLLEENLLELPIELGKLLKLKEFSVSSEHITQIPKEITKLKNIQCRIYLNSIEV
ncbi:MAG: hypothetical protein ACW981_04370 [Candidatus Hodarchaeales archaeon]